MITKEELEKAQATIFKWFMEQTAKDTVPTTLLDDTITTDDAKFRLITHLSFLQDEEK